ncbi:MAG TPA: hypothetical protein PKL56_19720 [Cyclobacteriaceae bacterium]|nr:hypothetical protein [Cyclobacteriaceae bacterium]HMV10442.1 hypothetical protein [Cyclobacteriaceae bacterium]HMX01366.1 hypothetical protein [Cyclobacteriaceae bacterium]HMX50364.1 hypothetical protein [Cyclobacteriaceae bacterium]HMY92432.1 hypothetical protein [Cyclobacteriaceae bacterium]
MVRENNYFDIKPVLLFAMVAVVGCSVDETTIYEFQIKNGLEDSVTVTAYYQQRGHLKMGTFTLTPDSSARLTSFERLGASKNSYDNDEKIHVLDSIIVRKSDGFESTKDFTLAGEWTFKRKSTQSAFYTLVIDESDF